MAGPFHGLLVLEFGRFIAVPYCGQLLADGGADVVKVEPLDGDPSRYNSPIVHSESVQFLNKNRGKRSLAIDLRNEEARAAVRRLVDRADVVVSNFRPGLAEQLELDYASAARTNPRVIYAQNTAFGRRGPLADEAGVDAVLQAYSGIAHFGPSGPSLLRNPIVDYGAALLLAWGISTALYTRERTGAGQKLDVSLLQAALVLQNNVLTHVDLIDEWREEFVDFLKTAFAEGASWPQVLQRRISSRPHAVARAYYGFFATGDGVVALGGARRSLQRRIADCLGIEDPWLFEPGWETDDLRGHFDEMHAKVAGLLRTRPTAYWLERLRAGGAPAAPVQLHEQLIDDEQVWANEYLVRLEHEALGGMTCVAPPVAFSETPLRAERASPPLGRHTREVLREAGLEAETIDRMLAAGTAREAKA